MKVISLPKLELITLKGLLNYENSEGWLDFKEIKENIPEFKSQTSNIPKYLGFLVDKKLLNKEEATVEDKRGRLTSKLLYRIKRKRSILIQLFLIFHNHNEEEIFFSSKYFEAGRKTGKCFLRRMSRSG